ncbi:TetR/AcrR family transcriptional regulator [Jiangella sp. DSM 45060]|uniref:TetR/AcrR family transcriptional regulator n=1 Tax=Jiangella sp. DSM 45060 TaxID=1798224 RepID=UPI00087D11D6|nr:TetR/AcrR family transcriptional regulator [Jiangella sp. DSM 45060]SDT72558.1 DNA-binding transcriptional regulator, AcrR family [Jiangella sp. DSM 45060]
MQAPETAGSTPTARERILATSYRLFARRGVLGVGVDEVIERSHVAKATFYKHFPSKNDLVLAYLDRREDEWTHGLVEAGSKARGDTPEERLLAIFDVFDEWFRSDDFDGIAFITVLLEMGRSHPLGQASIRHLANLRAIVSGRAAEAELRDPDGFARSWQILMKGSIIAALEGDIDAARRARSMAATLIEQHR